VQREWFCGGWFTSSDKEKIKEDKNLVVEGE